VEEDELTDDDDVALVRAVRALTEHLGLPLGSEEADAERRARGVDGPLRRGRGILPG
jgi:hypothetical protein